jgi:hypothetical protein
MAVAEREALNVLDPSSLAAFMAFARAIIAIPAVRRIDTAIDGVQMHWWIFLDDDPDDVLDRIYAAERILNQALGRVFLRARVIPLQSVDMTALPEAETFIER